MSDNRQDGLSECRTLLESAAYRESSALLEQIVSTMKGASLVEALTLQARSLTGEGRYEDALSSLRLCQETASREGDDEAQAHALIESGRLLTLLSRYELAVEAFQQATRLPPSPHLKVEFMAALSDTFARAGAPSFAELLCDAAIAVSEGEISEAAKTGFDFQRLMAERRLAMAHLAEQQGQYHRALYALEGIDNNTRDALAANKNQSDEALLIRRHAEGIAPMLDVVRGRLLLNLGDSQAAGEALQRAKAAAQSRGDVAIQVEAATHLGRIALEERKVTEAINLLAEAVELAERWLTDFEVEEFRVSLRIRLGELYARLAIAAVFDKNLPLLWQTMERARAREFLAALHSVGRPQVTLGPEMDRLDELSRHVSQLSSAMLQVDSDSPQFGRLREERKLMIDAKARHLNEMLRVPRKLALVQPLVESLDRVITLVGNDTAFVEYFFTLGPKLLALVVVDGKVSVVLIDAHPTAVAHRIQRFLRDLSVHPSRRTQDSWRLLAKQLYDGLWAPVAELVTSKSRVCVVPHGPLLDLPFAALSPVDDVPLLARFEIVYAPSGSILSAVGDQPAPRPERVAVFADPLPAGKWSLPGTRIEAEAVQRAPLAVQVRCGVEATPEAVIEAARGVDVLHLACHAAFDDKHPLLSSLLLASESGTPGLLEVHTIYGKEVRARLVVLSACETGRLERDPGAERQGFVRAFMVAGASAVVGSQWRVDDPATASLMSAFYEALGDSAPPGSALRAAQLQLASSREYGDPYYWAAFGLCGDWR